MPSPHAPTSALRLPRHLPSLRALEERGVGLARDGEESAEDHQARLETALMALFRDRRGEGEFQALYEHASPALLSWIAGVLQSRRSFGRASLDPLEVLQDTFVNVYRYAGGFRDDHGASFRVWSRRIASNLIRRGALHGRGRSLQALPEGRQEPTDRRAGPAEGLLIDEERRSLSLAWMIVLMQYAAAYQALGERDRRALDLIEVEGLSYAEASRRLRVGLSNMKMILFRARRRIRARIGALLEARRAAAQGQGAGRTSARSLAG